MDQVVCSHHEVEGENHNDVGEEDARIHETQSQLVVDAPLEQLWDEQDEEHGTRFDPA